MSESTKKLVDAMTPEQSAEFWKSICERKQDKLNAAEAKAETYRRRALCLLRQVRDKRDWLRLNAEINATMIVQSGKNMLRAEAAEARAERLERAGKNALIFFDALRLEGDIGKVLRPDELELYRHISEDLRGVLDGS